MENFTLRNSKGQFHPIHNFDEFAFDPPYSNLAMYFIGIVVTDGCIIYGINREPRIQLAITDKDIVERFIEFLKYSGSMQTYRVSKSTKDIFRVSIASTHLVRSLEKIGCTRNKSLILKINDSILLRSKDFWRGVIDGDGCLSIGKNLTIELATSSIEFAEQFKQFCKNYSIKANIHKKKTYTKNTAYKVKVYSNQAIRLASILYKDCCFAMERKLQIYKEHFCPLSLR